MTYPGKSRRFESGNIYPAGKTFFHVPRAVAAICLYFGSTMWPYEVLFCSKKLFSPLQAKYVEGISRSKLL